MCSKKNREVMKTRDCLCGMLLVGVALLVASCKPEEEPIRGRIGNIMEVGKTWYMFGYMYDICTYEETACFIVDYKVEEFVDRNGRVMVVLYHWMDGAEYSLNRLQEGSKFYDSYIGKTLFDFDAAKGDVLALQERRSGNEYASVAVRDVFDTILPGGDGKKRRAVLVESGDVWVEDIGSLTYGIRQRDPVEGEPVWQLIGCEKDGVWYYKHPDFEAFVEEAQNQGVCGFDCD